MIYDKQDAAEDWYNDSRKTKQDLLRWYDENGGTESLDDPGSPTNLVNINGVATEMPTGAMAYKYADSTEGDRWVYDQGDLAEIKSEDPSLLEMPASMLREDWADVIMAHYAATKLVILNKSAVDIDVARNLMDDDICGEIRGTVDTEQEFVDAYCAAHEAKYGETFTVN
jgi:hypothetical protein